ncbi:MAG: hypothetical protein ACOCUH_01055 [Bacteriovoracia bacterium]
MITYFKTTQEKLTIDIDLDQLSPAQIRLIKSLNTMLAHILTTDQEGEFFEGSAEFMRMCASIIKQANFADNLKMNGIPYAEQALEYSMDSVNEYISKRNVVTYDN